MWATRDKDGDLRIWTQKPIKDNYGYWRPEKDSSPGIFWITKDRGYEWISYDDDPVEIILESKEHLDELLEVEFQRGFIEGEHYGYDEGYEDCQKDYE